MARERMGKFDLWEVESTLDTILRASEHTQDKALMVQVRKLAKKRDTAMQNSGLINRAMKKKRGN